MQKRASTKMRCIILGASIMRNEPAKFLQLVYGTLGGYIVFGDVSNIWIVTGGATVIAANAFLLLEPALKLPQPES